MIGIASGDKVTEIRLTRPYAPVVKGAPATGYACYCDTTLTVPKP